MIAITTVIPGARTLDQLTEGTFDTQVDENARENCVAASLAEGLNILVGGGQQKYVGDTLHDAVYGQGHLGPQAARRYVDYCHAAGVSLHAVGGSQAQLVAIIHQHVPAGHPVIVTMPSHWGTVPADPLHPAGGTHVGLAVGIGPGGIRVMNPWHGFMQDASDAWWQARLCEGEVWVMAKAHAAPTTDTVAHPAGQATSFYGLEYTADAQIWHSPSTGRTLAHGFLGYYQSLRGAGGSCATQMLGLPISDEYPSTNGQTRQDFERGALVFAPHGSGAWQIYFGPVGQELRALRSQSVQQATADAQTIATLQAQVATLKAEIATLRQQA